MQCGICSEGGSALDSPLPDEEHVLGLLADAGPLPADAGVGDVQRLREPEVKPLALPRLRYPAS